MPQGIRLAVVGITGAVGQEIIRVLEQRDFPVSELIALADPREAGSKVQFKGESITVEAAEEKAFRRAEVALFAVGNDISLMLAPLAQKAGCLVIDNSYAFRLRDGVPLVVPEVNPEDIAAHQGIIANPNCSTIIMAVAINPIYRAAGIKRLVVSTYQAVSGAGINGLRELEQQSRDYLEGRDGTPEVFAHPIPFNLIPHIDIFVDEDYTREEMKMVWETRKIFHAPDMLIAPTCVRVPVFRSHSESINIETERPLSVAAARELLKSAEGIVLQDDPAQNQYPMPRYTSDKDEVFVGRLRRDLSVDNGIAMWVAADQIRKGAATNAIQIAERVVADNLF
ncbi:MAG: aspartate-semialdehyde dehydrogenase [Syntrophomonadaceae bacterium]|nr:aspartate-semialdehyde dehydrogenase [Syntrophomonadaceae bacterium]